MLAVVLTGGLHLAQRQLDFVVQDEGYLWYGVQAVLRGELPLRDFNSYDPGRYLWCAAWGKWAGSGIGAVRLAGTIFGALGLFLGLLVAARVVGRRWLLVPAGVVLALWMQPRWKVFDAAIALSAVYVATLLIERASLRRHLFAGVFAGLAAFFGRNHGVYVSVGLVALITLVALRTAPRELPRRLATWGGGVLLGYAPMLALIAFAPGFRAAFVESIAYFSQQGHLAAKKPVPWPWRADYAALDVWSGAHALGVGLAYLLLPAFYLPSLVGVVRARSTGLERRAPWMAATLVGAAYVHHASVHAAYNHLSQAIGPLLLGVMALPAALPRGRTLLGPVLAVGALLVLALGANLPALGVVQKLRAEGTAQARQPLKIGQDELLLSPGLRAYLQRLTRAVEENVPPDEQVFLGPLFPGLYCMLGRRAPTWDVYMAWTGTDASQARLVEQLAHVDWALVDAGRPLGREWLELENSNPRAWLVLQRDFEVVELGRRLPPMHRLLRRRSWR